MLFSCHFACLDFARNRNIQHTLDANNIRCFPVMTCGPFFDIVSYALLLVRWETVGCCCRRRCWWNVWIYDWNSFVWNENTHTYTRVDWQAGKPRHQNKVKREKKQFYYTFPMHRWVPCATEVLRQIQLHYSYLAGDWRWCSHGWI